MQQKYNIFLFVLRGLAIRYMNQGNSLQLLTALGHTETSKKRIQTMYTLCASTREAFRMRGLAILTAALGPVYSSSREDAARIEQKWRVA